VVKAVRIGDDGRMARDPLPPVAAVVGFIDRINRGDAAGLGALMTPDHRLQVLDEPAVVGRDANLSAWRGYLTSFPHYVIYPHQVVERNGQVAVLGHTTGSHLGLPDDQEALQTVIWVAQVRDGLLSLWRILQDSPAGRRALGLS
jgi:SnoaL-like domain